MSEAYWICECTACTWEHYSFTSRRANSWADAHTEETGHKTTVKEWYA